MILKKLYCVNKRRINKLDKIRKSVTSDNDIYLNSYWSGW